MKLSIFIFMMLISGSLSFATPAFVKKYPHGLLTNDYGVLNEDDLATDAWRGEPKPFDKDGFNGGYPYWQCFPRINTIARYSTWRDSDPMGRSDVVVDLCGFEFVVEVGNTKHIYVGRRAERISACRTRAKSWKRITRSQKYICFDGYGGTLEVPNKPHQKPAQIWTWDRIKTRAGCLSYFDGLCDMKEWRRQGYPQR